MNDDHHAPEFPFRARLGLPPLNRRRRSRIHPFGWACLAIVAGHVLFVVAGLIF